MTKILTEAGPRLNADTRVIGFGMTDKSGREIGLQVYTDERDYTAKPEGSTYGCLRAPGHYFTAECWATRAGKPFGACQPTKHFDTAEARDAYVAERIEANRKSYAAKVAKGKV